MLNMFHTHHINMFTLEYKAYIHIVYIEYINLLTFYKSTQLQKKNNTTTSPNPKAFNMNTFAQFLHGKTEILHKIYR